MASDTDGNYQRRRRKMGEAAYVVTNLVAGVWLLISPYLFEGVIVDEQDDFVVGVLLVILAVYGLYRVWRGSSIAPSAILVSFAAGMWLGAFSLEFGNLTLMHDNVVVGAALAVLNAVLFRRFFYDPFEGW